MYKILVFTVCVGSVIVYRSSWKHIILFCIVQPTDGAILPSHTVYTTGLATYLLLQEAHIPSVMFCVIPPDLCSCKLHIRVKVLILTCIQYIRASSDVIAINISTEININVCRSNSCFLNN